MSAALLYIALGIGFGAGTVVTLDHLRREGELPMTPWVFRSLAGGPFEQLPPENFVALGWALVGVCALDILTGRGCGRGAGAVPCWVSRPPQRPWAWGRGSPSRSCSPASLFGSPLCSSDDGNCDER